MQVLPHQRYKCKCKKVKWQAPKRRKASSRNQIGRFLKNAKIDVGNNRENDKPEIGKLQALDKSSNSMYGSVPKAQPWEMQQLLKICSWNIRRGLIKRELELKDMLNSEKLNIMFLVETDTKLPNGKSDYKIEGYATVLQKTNQVNDIVKVTSFQIIRFPRIEINRT